jgi:hypothetical protein
MKKNIVKLTVLVLPMLLLVTSAGFAAESKKVSQVPAELATGEQIKWQVISSGGTKGTSTNYVLTGTVGQTAVGYGSSANHGLSHGFWQEYGPTTCCNHDGIRGDVDMSGTINVADASFLMAYLKSIGPAPGCDEEADVNGSGTINVADASYLMAYLKSIGPAPPACP